MDDIISQTMGTDNHIADILGIDRYIHFQGMLHRPN